MELVCVVPFGFRCGPLQLGPFLAQLLGLEFPLAFATCRGRHAVHSTSKLFVGMAGQTSPQSTCHRGVLLQSGACLKIPSLWPLGPAGETPSEIGRCSSHTCATLQSLVTSSITAVPMLSLDLSLSRSLSAPFVQSPLSLRFGFTALLV